MARFRLSLKFIGLILLVILTNDFPVVLIKHQEHTPIVLQWGLSISYLIMTTLIIWRVWKAYFNREHCIISARPFRGRDLFLLFYFLLPYRYL